MHKLPWKCLTFNQDYHRNDLGDTYVQGRQNVWVFFFGGGVYFWLISFLYLFTRFFFRGVGGGQCKKSPSSSTGPAWRQFEYQSWFLINVWTNSLLSVLCIKLKRRFIFVCVILRLCQLRTRRYIYKSVLPRSWFLIRDHPFKMWTCFRGGEVKTRENHSWLLFLNDMRNNAILCIKLLGRFIMDLVRFWINNNHESFR